MAKSGQFSGSKLFVWILIGLLILGLAGFGIGSFTSSVSAIGSVGDEEITVDDYYQQLQSEIESFAGYTGQRLTPLQAIQFGLGQNALESLVLQAAIDNEAAQVGVSVGDQTIMDELASMPQFRGADGRFSRDAYNFTLERTGMTAADFDQAIREAQTRNLIETTVAGGIPPSGAYIDRLLYFHLSARDVTWAHVTPGMLDGATPPPTDQELRDFHSANEAEFTLPEIRHITAAWITPDRLADPGLVAQSRVRELYDERTEQFSRPDRRDVDRLVFPDRLSAAAAKRRLDGEEITFGELAGELGILISDISLGPVERADLAQEAADAVFASDTTDIVGPVESRLGPALFRINAVLGAQFTSFESARAGLAEELALEDAQSDITDSITAIEDLLAGGATIEELVSESDMVLERIAFDENSSDGIAAFGDFHTAAAAASPGDFPELLELGGGGLFAFRLDRVEAPKIQPYAEAREQVADAWARQKQSERLQARAEQLAAKLGTGSDFAELGLSEASESDLTRSRFVDGAPFGLAEAAFSTDVRQASAFGSGSEWGVLRVNSESPPDPGAEETARTIDSLNGQFSAGAGRDTVALYSDHLRRQAGLQLDLEIIDAIHAQLH